MATPPSLLLLIPPPPTTANPDGSRPPPLPPNPNPLLTTKVPIGPYPNRRSRGLRTHLQGPEIPIPLQGRARSTLSTIRHRPHLMDFTCSTAAASSSPTAPCGLTSLCPLIMRISLICRGPHTGPDSLARASSGLIAPLIR